MPDWWSYDGVAEAYEQFTVPRLFDHAAEDLVALLELRPGASVLDVGTGTGAAALRALKLAGGRSKVAGIDPSFEMLRIARSKGLEMPVAGSVPGLPFRPNNFDAVIANFVLSHIAAYEDSLLDMVRVLRPAGRLALAAWGATSSNAREIWNREAERATGAETFKSGMQEALPAEDLFRDPKNIEQALREAGLNDVRIHEREYQVTLSVEEYLSMRDASLEARLIQQHLGASGWRGFRQRVAEALARGLNRVEEERQAYFGLGTKPSG